MTASFLGCSGSLTFLHVRPRKTRKEAARLAGNYNATIHMGLGLLPYIASPRRVAAIASVRVPEPYERGIKRWFSAAPRMRPT